MYLISPIYSSIVLPKPKRSRSRYTRNVHFNVPACFYCLNIQPRSESSLSATSITHKIPCLRSWSASASEEVDLTPSPSPQRIFLFMHLLTLFPRPLPLPLRYPHTKTRKFKQQQWVNSNNASEVNKPRTLKSDHFEDITGSWLTSESKKCERTTEQKAKDVKRASKKDRVSRSTNDRSFAVDLQLILTRRDACSVPLPLMLIPRCGEGGDEESW